MENFLELTPEEIEENRARFCKIFSEKITRKGSDRLLEWLNNSDFFTAPASTRFHEAYPGGLCEHSLCVYDKLVALQEGNAVTTVWNEEQTAILALLHDVCKANFYKLGSRNVKNEETGKWEKVPTYTIEDQLPYGHGEKSVFIIERVMRLKIDEAMAIRWHMGAYDESVKGGSYAEGNAYEMFPAAVSLHIADMLATYQKK